LFGFSGFLGNIIHFVNGIESRSEGLEMSAAHWKLGLRPGIQKHFGFFGLSGLFG